MSDLPVSTENLRKTADYMQQASGVDPNWLREAADRIEALEADLKVCAVRLEENTATMDMARARIEALEAALRLMLTDPPAARDEPDTDAEVIQHYREVARAALAPEAGG